MFPTRCQEKHDPPSQQDTTPALPRPDNMWRPDTLSPAEACMTSVLELAEADLAAFTAGLACRPYLWLGLGALAIGGVYLYQQQTATVAPNKPAKSSYTLGGSDQPALRSSERGGDQPSAAPSGAPGERGKAEQHCCALQGRRAHCSQRTAACATETSCS